MNPGRLKAWGWRYAERFPFVYAAGATIAFVFPPIVLYVAMGLNSIEIAVLLTLGAPLVFVAMLVNFRKAGFWGPDHVPLSLIPSRHHTVPPAVCCFRT